MTEPSGGELVGLVPAAGQATRLGRLPCSKELYPVGWQRVDDGTPRPKVACHYLLEEMRRAGARRAYIVLRRGKWDIPDYFGDGEIVDMDLAYLATDETPGVPWTLDVAFPFLQDATVLFGFPDILVRPTGSFREPLERFRESDADVVLAVFPTDDTEKMDMLQLDPGGRVRKIAIKPGATPLEHTWAYAVWGPSFTRFLHDILLPSGRLAGAGEDPATQETAEVFVGDVLRYAIEDGMRVDGCRVPGGRCLDIGTGDALVGAAHEHLHEHLSEYREHPDPRSSGSGAPAESEG